MSRRRLIRGCRSCCRFCAAKPPRPPLGRVGAVGARLETDVRRVGRDGLEQGQKRRGSRELDLELEAENEELKAALGEAHVQLRVWRKGAEFLPPSRTSR